MGSIGSSNSSNERWSRIDSVHEQALSKLAGKNNEIVQSTVIPVPDVNSSKDSHIITALVKGKSGNYTIRSASFSEVDGEYKQRNNFSIFRQLRGLSETTAKDEYEDFIIQIKRRK